MNDSWLLDPAEEIRRKLERGEFFNLSKDQFGAVVNIAAGAARWAGIEPAEIRRLADEPGAEVRLYGRDFVYSIRMRPAAALASLYALPLDSKLGGAGVLLYEHEFQH
jgi:hypothetical protein